MTNWRRACESNACVEVGAGGDRILVRNSTRPDLVVEFTPVEWAAFLAGVRRGEFDIE